MDDASWDNYQCWMAALEQGVVKFGILQEDELESRFSGILDCKDGLITSEDGLTDRNLVL